MDRMSMTGDMGGSWCWPWGSVAFVPCSRRARDRCLVEVPTYAKRMTVSDG